jgi:competence protein ComGC
MVIFRHNIIYVLFSNHRQKTGANEGEKDIIIIIIIIIIIMIIIITYLLKTHSRIQETPCNVQTYRVY